MPDAVAQSLDQNGRRQVSDGRLHFFLAPGATTPRWRERCCTNEQPEQLSLSIYI